jgi:DNA replication protein DnaC
MATVKTPEPAHLVADLKTLCLTSLAKEWERFAQTARAKRQPHQDFLADAAAFEVTQRRERRIQRRLQEARFPVLKTLDGFDFKAPHSLDRDEVLDLFACDFIDQAANVVLIGGVGTGKTHLAIALGMACVQKDRRVRFTTAAELCNLLVEAKRDGRLSRKLDQMARYDVVVLDELGYVPFDREGSDLLFNFVTKVYERRSLVVTTNLPFAKWSQVFGDATAAAAVIDRIVHHATVLQTKGASYRLKDAKAKRPRRRRKEVTRS